MPNPQARIERGVVRRRTRLEVGRIAVLVILVAAVAVTNFTGRHDLVASQRAGCARGKLDRAANARGWRIAQHARQVTANDPAASSTERASARHAAEVYARIATGLEKRSRINCSQLFPEPGIF